MKADNTQLRILLFSLISCIAIGISLSQYVPPSGQPLFECWHHAARISLSQALGRPQMNNGGDTGANNMGQTIYG
ncbi:hypothetical protein GGR58DRAFT_480345 [Xylaria digitata]|nr:hypothetical protein GGR58DRAFT_480345 [Xylaria digitata]